MLVLDREFYGITQGGILILDKPEGITSARAAAKIKKLLKPRKIGHTGTLDPFATGVLVLCLNEATRAADQITLLNKIYRAVLRFGVETDTMDKTGSIVRQTTVRFSEADLMDVLQLFSGLCLQTVPSFSAVRVDGHRLYELSRKGIEVELPEREICIHSIALKNFEWPEALIEVCCSKGTYIRRLASDIGQKLGSGAHLVALTRTNVGPFSIEQAVQWNEHASAEQIAAAVIPTGDALSHLPAALMSDQESLAKLKNGQLDPEWEKTQHEFYAWPEAVRIVTEKNRLAALWWPRSVSGASRRLRVFPF